MPSTTPFDQAYYGEYSGFSSSMLPHPSLSNANQEETYSILLFWLPGIFDKFILFCYSGNDNIYLS